jgi:AcrR family transcriptional regulator
VGRQRVAELIEAAAVIQERGFEAATMAKIAARAEAKRRNLLR